MMMVFWPDRYTIPIAAHECVHAAWAILDHVGVEVSQENDEMLAYLVGFLMEKVEKVRQRLLGEKNA